MSERFSLLTRQERSRVLAREAARTLEERGCFHLRVEDIARGAGVAKGTVYLDFGSKASLLSKTLSEVCGLLLGMIEARVEQPGSEGGLRGALLALAEAATNKGELGVLLERRLPCATRWIEGDDSSYERLEQRLAELVSESDRSPGFDPTLIAQAVLAVASTPRSRQLANERGPRALADALWGVVSSMMCESPPA